ncbi:hypothetical protein DL89DRAFT_266596 [Linderina pennispora]|uniref:Uncharacterized protein n=1 Tax=Linderina pennispora TaxID=61395 RepID=A0A1Y1WDJ9_9FUNG|nr:uncharacterized protein DL89DRAFT_266596 [Linderina pennispora]ORX71600.1 hypothetical protein DL89DRAFT_266596 [Linderina pennispora]
MFCLDFQISVLAASIGYPCVCLACYGAEPTTSEPKRFRIGSQQASCHRYIIPLTQPPMRRAKDYNSSTLRSLEQGSQSAAMLTPGTAASEYATASSRRPSNKHVSRYDDMHGQMKRLP